MTELLGFEPSADEHKVQWLSVGGDDRFKQLFLDILCLTDAGPRMDRGYFSTERAQARRLQRAVLRAARAEGRRADSRSAARRMSRAGVQRAIEDAVIRMAGEGENLCLAGGLGLNALLVSALENAVRVRERLRAAGRGQCGHGDRRGARRLARRVPADGARAAAIAVPGPGVHARPRSSRCSRTASCASGTWSPRTK